MSEQNVTSAFAEEVGEVVMVNGSCGSSRLGFHIVSQQLPTRAESL